MDYLFVFAVTLILSVLVSGVAQRTILSTAVLFLVSGTLAQSFGWFHLTIQSALVQFLPEIALLLILFTDSMNISIGENRQSWHLPLTALLIGLPLTLALTAVILHFAFDVDWMKALLIGAILSPTDPIFAEALVSNKRIPLPVRHLLNVESGLNDGLSFPLVLVLLQMLTYQQVKPFHLLSEIATGICIGFLAPWILIKVEGSRLFGSSLRYRPLFAVSILIVVYALAKHFNGNEFLAVFISGLVVGNYSPVTKDKFQPLAEPVAELFKLAAILMFGGFFTVDSLTNFSWKAYAGALLILVVARPVALMMAFYRSSLRTNEKIVAAWFGPRGFASVVFALFVLKSSYLEALEVFQFTALVVGMSIIMHSSTDVIAAKWIRKSEGGEDRTAANRKNLGAEGC